MRCPNMRCNDDVIKWKRLSKQSQGWWFETPSCPLWRQCNAVSDPPWVIIRRYIYVCKRALGIFVHKYCVRLNVALSLINGFSGGSMYQFYGSLARQSSCPSCYQVMDISRGSLFLPCINFNLSMDDQLHALSSVCWNYLSVPKLSTAQLDSFRVYCWTKS